MKYKVGDKVKIKSLEWYNSLEKDEDGTVYLEKYKNYINSDMALFFGQEAIIKDICSLYYRINLDGEKWSWSDDMFENETMVGYTELINIANNSKNNVCTPIDWEQRKFDAAKAAIQGLCAVNDKGSFTDINEFYERTAMHAINIADKLVKRLRK